MPFASLAARRTRSIDGETGPGAWAGMFAFRHKTNFRKKPAIWLFLILATVGHAALAYTWFLRGR